MRSFQISCFLAWRGLPETHAMNHHFFIFRHPCPNVVIFYAVYLQDSDWCTRCWSESSALLCQWHHSVSQRKGPKVSCICFWSVKWWFSALQVALKRLKHDKHAYVHSETRSNFHAKFIQKEIQNTTKQTPFHFSKSPNCQIGISNAEVAPCSLVDNWTLWSVQSSWWNFGNQTILKHKCNLM